MTAGSTRKIVINKSYGEFCVSHEAFRSLREMGQRDALLAGRVEIGRAVPEPVRRADSTG
jgi:hypothetical protein